MRPSRPPASATALAVVLSLCLIPAAGPLAGPAAASAAAPGAAPAVATPADDDGIVIDSSLFGALRARQLGPAVTGGRVAAIDGVAADPRILYVGAAGGGVWKSRNGGLTFEPVFDDHCQSIGAITVDQARPDTVWVGTGEVWVRNSVSVGDGVYRSTDGGESWRHLGLAGSERIGRIVIDPYDPDVVWVAALGPLWSDGAERGVFRSEDGGRTWRKVLYVDESTGCADLTLVPGAPNVVLAAMWDFRREPDFFRSGGPGSGLYRSLDGGATWERLREGLPEGELGRIALAASPARPSRIYALVESEDTGFYRSDDMGQTWRRLSNQRPVKSRPFYFALVVPDPVDPDRVYLPGYRLLVSRDGGEHFEGVGGWVHVDYHALWIAPGDPSLMYVGNDGGVYATGNLGAEWRHCATLPISQFYRVTVDDAEPYRVYGGLQDNGSWRAPSSSPGGIENGDWENLGGGDGFAVLRDPRDPDLVYWEWQGGNVNRLHLGTGDNKDIQPLPDADGPKLRFSWNTPIEPGRSDPGRLYVGSQFLHRSLDQGDTWRRLSPDLTTNDPAKQRQERSGGLTVDNTTAENHCTIVTISESPLDGAVIWAGTDDGNLQVTEDDGATWRETAAAAPGLPRGTWVSCVEASRHARGTAYATFDGHRTGDMAPRVYRTRDLGRTWEPLTTDGVEGYCHVLREDPVSPDLLFLGTEAGLHVTVDGGRHWARYEERFPPVPVMDLAIQPRGNDLVVATHGRGIWIIDDYSPLRHLTRACLERDVCLLPSPPAHQVIRRGKQQFPGDAVFIGGNPPETARIIYYLKKRHLLGEMKLEVLDPDGEVVKVLPGGKRKGINVVGWSMRLRPPKVTTTGVLDPSTAFAGSVGPAAPEGTYTYRLSKGDSTYTGTIEVVADPLSPHPAEDRRLQQRTVLRLYRQIEELSWVVDSLARLRDQADERAAGLPGRDRLGRRLRELAARAGQLRSGLVAPEDEVQGIPGIERLREELIDLYAAVAMYGGRPAAAQLDRCDHFDREIARARADLEALTGERLSDLNQELAGRELAPIEVESLDSYRERES